MTATFIEERPFDVSAKDDTGFEFEATDRFHDEFLADHFESKFA
jgi:hypothetical protein